MGPLTLNVIVSPAVELAMASRNEPGPESAVVVTVAAQLAEDGIIADTIKRNGIDFLMVGSR